jgi:hypothetical protein
MDELRQHPAALSGARSSADFRRKPLLNVGAGKAVRGDYVSSASPVQVQRYGDAAACGTASGTSNSCEMSRLVRSGRNAVALMLTMAQKRM